MPAPTRRTARRSWPSAQIGRASKDWSGRCARDIPTFVWQCRTTPPEPTGIEALTAEVAAYEPDLVISAGFMKLVGR